MASHADVCKTIRTDVHILVVDVFVLSIVPSTVQGVMTCNRDVHRDVSRHAPKTLRDVSRHAPTDTQEMCPGMPPQTLRDVRRHA